MSEGYNRVLLFGNLGADPELRVTQSGQAVLNLRIACTETYKDRNDQKQERTEWVQCVMWGRRAEGVAKYLHKGDRVLIEGSLRTETYEKDGEKRYSTKVNVTDLKFGGGSRREGGEARSQRSGGAGGSTQERWRPPHDPAPADDGGGWGDQGGGSDDEIPFVRDATRYGRWSRP